MQSLRASFVLATCFAAASSSASGGDLPWVDPVGGARVDRHVLVKVEPGVALVEGDRSSGWSSTGIDEIDALDLAFDVVAVHRVHADPPGGHRDPARFRFLGLDRIYWFAFNGPQADVPSIAAQYEALPTVERSWADGMVRSCRTPNDPQWSSQWNLTPEDLNCEPAWDSLTSSSALVAIVDSGGDLAHPDLDGNLWVNPGEVAGNGKDDDGNGYVDDVNGWDFWNGDSDPSDDAGHGSHVSGILGAEGDNGRDVAGICWSASVLEVKVLDSTGAGTWTTISQGITYAADTGALVANYSLGGTGGDPGVESAVDYAASLDVVQVAAAGNNGNSTEFFPAAYDGVIAVMASDIQEKRAAWSNYGDWCDLCAPGDGITSLWKNGGTNALTGTSQSSPHVAGIAAMVRTANPQLDRVDVELVIEHSAKDLGTAGRDNVYQWGLADLHQALAKSVSLSLSTTSAGVGSSVDLHVARPDSGGDVYLLLPSISGRLPGVDLSAYFANCYRVLPLNDDLVTDLSLKLPNVGVFVNFLGYLDAAGYATATFVVPRGRLFLQQTVVFSGLLFDASDFSAPTHVLNSVQLEVQ
jgi:hypothetical protein